MRRIRRIILGGFGLGLALVLSLPVALAEPEHADVRVLIDVSGSMKQNDPDNLRRPALRMMVGLIQPGTRAGVWTFAGGADELVARGQVDEAWKEQGALLSRRIDSPGQFTDIEGALRLAISDWRDTEPEYRRHILLLTDGMVDVSDQKDESLASRQRILDQLLPELKSLTVQVHAVALSDRADHELMQRLSAETGGWYQKVDAAAQLQKSFLRIFEKAGRPDALPLVGNKFEVDRSVREATVLVFRREGAKETRLIAPDGQAFAGSDIAAGVAWRRDEGYDLITIAKPAVGEWSLEADMDPDNRVMVVTDLKLQFGELPNRVAVGEALPVIAHLSNHGAVINQRAFLDLLTLHAEVGVADRRDSLAINDRGERGDRQAEDGYFSARLRRDHAEDALELRLAAESETFVRQRRHVLSVLEPLSVELIAEHADQPPGVRVTLNEGVVEPDADVQVWQESPGGTFMQLTTERNEEGGFVAPMIDPAMPLFARVLGKGRSGQVVERSYGPLFLPGFEARPEPLSEPVAEQPLPTEQQPEAETSSDDQVTIALFVSANVLLVSAGGLFWWLRRRRKREEITLVDDEGKGDLLDAALDIAIEEGAVGKEERAA